MKIIAGPTYRYQGERLSRPEIIVIQDHHYDAESGYALSRLLSHSECPADQHLLVFDHVLRQDEFASYNHVCLPLLLAAECQEFNQQRIAPRWGSRTHAFNFIVNKPRDNRLILLDLIDQLDLASYRHSLCWRQGYKSIQPTHLVFGDERLLDQGVLNGHHKNASTYDCLLRRTIFEPTSVSLITEPAFHERETIVTEKTLMAIWAGTLPIWVGGWRCADTMRDFGFDVFDDVIDHSYQSLDDPAERCRQAVLRNISLLRRAQDLTAYHSRLAHNVDLLRANPFLERVRSLVQQYPDLRPLVNQFRNGSLAQG